MADALHAHVRALHTQAEQGGIVNDVLNGRAKLTGYLTFLRNLLPCYEALEDALARRHDSVLLGELAPTEIRRSGSIRADLRLYAPEWQTSMALMDQASAYAQRIRACDTGDGRLLIAHAYVRYLGDLNGGAVILRRLQPLLDRGGLSFHAFSAIDDLAAFRLDYRASIDRAGARLEDWSPVLSEAAVAFQLNIGLSEAVPRQLAAFP